MLSFLASAVGISLSGVMAPGPTTAATVQAGMHRKHAGAMIALGHGVVEFPLMLVVMWSVTLLKSPWFGVTVGLVGGACLLYMGGGMLAALRKPEDPARQAEQRHPFVTGIIVTGGNPYFLVWWASGGLALCTQAIEYGPLAFALFAAAHWLCDLVWLEALSWSAFKGSVLLTVTGRKAILAVCGLGLVGFGTWFICRATAAMIG